MTDNAGMTAPDDHPAEKPPASSGRASLNNSWILTAAGGVIGAYFLVSGALTMRDKHGNGVFALLMAVIVLAVGAVAWMLVRQYRAERAARK